ncbi:KipI family sensor histidine kinase inhibitor [Okibacterium sp. HSC-33S16]|uniref:5-oxoprolinase subunit B family protein n=1 Tax=Okibacterium sp. HSC-33S16 TaxID=2910965 RepID=UPI00209ED792|nr:carboxyltransferase domain-containing protein [Okibacterium sp. HSC-33S16]MCP2029957.1 KipI family sensor histidine kinase inhibitor [Okibacterium sp. HSC-33S16]
MSRTVRTVGDRGVLVDCASMDEVLAVSAGLADDPPVGVVDVVPAARSVLVRIDPTVLPVDRAVDWVRRTPERPTGGVDVDDAVVIDVDYSGEDLSDVARFLACTERDVVDRHTGTHWRVAFVGFAPGFGYLVADDAGLTVPRRVSPRTSVPAGTVGLAGEFTGIYPRSSPGGWQILGHTDTVLWDPAAAEPALLRPGRLVRFRESI